MAYQMIHGIDAAVQDQIMAGGTQQRKSGRTNVSGLPGLDPARWWPHEGVLNMQGARKPTYDDLSIAQWASGQLANILHVHDSCLQRRMLMQMLYALRDACTLPWAAVRLAYGTSMQQIEEGHLDWANTTDWAFNRMGASNIAMSCNVQAVRPRPKTPNNTDKKSKLCWYFVEGTCNQSSDHGIYYHPCMACFRHHWPADHDEHNCPLRTTRRNDNRIQPR